jgi:flagellar protein FliO/FliZ
MTTPAYTTTVALKSQITASAPVTGTETGSMASSFITTIFALAFVLALAWCGIYLLKRIQGKTQGDRSELKFIQAMSIGQKERVVIIEYNDHRYLLGITASSVSLLEKTALETINESKFKISANKSLLRRVDSEKT